jgi:formylmethanofuran dehydrogenase subunit D
LDKNKVYTGQVSEICENGDAIITFSDEMINDLDWREGDDIDIIFENGVVVLKNLTKERTR